VDPGSGYRLYDPAQLDRARLIARLRRIGMPLAEIRAVCAQEPAGAAAAIDAYRQRVTDDTVARARLAAFLVQELSAGDAAAPEPVAGMRSAAGCDMGAVRDSNEDVAFAGERLLAVADGMRGPGGAAAGAAAVQAVKALERAEVPAAELIALLAGAVAGADHAVRGIAAGGHRPVSTLTAMLRSGFQVALVHVGDTRAYLLRDGELSPLTRDHTVVQSLVDQGRLRAGEVSGHPQRALLVRALGAGGRQVEADLAVRTALPGDRYLLCSDGLHAVVGRPGLRAALRAAAEPEQAVRRLIALAHEAGAPDNIACAVADITGGGPGLRRA
jgi:serine/threonine protein phosphatase PrpC